MIGLLGSARAESNSTSTSAIEQRLAETDRYLSSDELEGRGLGGTGLDLAADFIARKFREVGLRTDLFGGTPFQTFTRDHGDRHGVGQPPDAGRSGRIGRASRRCGLTLALNRDFTPTVDSGSGNFDLPLVFVGYGITAKPERYDDYAGVKVAGKAVVLLRAQAAAGQSGKRLQRHPGLGIFLSAAEDLHGLRAWGGGGRRLQRPVRRSQPPARRRRAAAIPAAGRSATCPATFRCVHVHRAVMDRAVRAAWASIWPRWRGSIDLGPTPHSAELPGWRIAGKVDIRRTEHEVKNVLGVLDGQRGRRPTRRSLSAPTTTTSAARVAAIRGIR